MSGGAKPIVAYDAAGRSVGVFGLLEILAEEAAWIRGQVSNGDFLSDESESDRFREFVDQWSLELVRGTAKEIRRCWKEIPSQISDDDLKTIVRSYGQSIQHAGLCAPTFVELVCQTLAVPFCFICEVKTTKGQLKTTLRVMANSDLNFELLAAEVSRELRLTNRTCGGDIKYSRHRPIAEWLKLLKKLGVEISEDTFSRRRSGKAMPSYRVNPVGSRSSVSLAIEDLPSDYSDSAD